MEWKVKMERLDSTRDTVAFLGHKSTNSVRLVGKLAVDTKAARQSGAAGIVGSSATLAWQTKLKGC